ncbi:MAG: AAA family ATPase [Gammaproteobacteria bacterium]|nr:AAA family ATPase [Gammaproteobacteria bacterium]MYB39165.1 AAA family ATPase [Gammaproteobacteria bacterium]
MSEQFSEQFSEHPPRNEDHAPRTELQARLERIRIRGFRSLADVELGELDDLTVVVGPSGAGKSNFVRFFDMLSWMLRSRRLGEFVARYGGADDQLFGGADETMRLEADLSLRTQVGRNDYRFALSHAHPDRFVFIEEAFRFSRDGLPTEANWRHLGAGHHEAQIVDAGHPSAEPSANRTTAATIVRLLRSCATYQFQDTSDESNFKRRWDADDNLRLRRHGGNLAALLWRLEEEDPEVFEEICVQIRRALPGFGKFEVDENYGKVTLAWRANWSERRFTTNLTSDGSIRLFALLTLLNLPSDLMPNVVLVDEPELGLHPAAIEVVADSVQALAGRKQVLIVTQSPRLVDALDVDEVVTFDFLEGRTQARRRDRGELQAWLEEDFSNPM